MGTASRQGRKDQRHDDGRKTPSSLHALGLLLLRPSTGSSCHWKWEKGQRYIPIKEEKNKRDLRVKTNESKLAREKKKEYHAPRASFSSDLYDRMHMYTDNQFRSVESKNNTNHHGKPRAPDQRQPS